MTKRKATIGNRLAPPRFLLFLALLLPGGAAGAAAAGWRIGIMLGFDAAALAFLASLVPLFRADPRTMRDQAAANDANRAMLLAVTAAVMAAVLTAVAAELSGGGSSPSAKAVVIATLAVAWLFSNMVYALHYAHLFYLKDPESGGDCGGIAFPGEEEPGYWDFVYFSFTLGMTFQTSDVEIDARAVRKTVVFHCLAAFVFNLGVIAFTINVLGSGGG
ncbi:MAG: DUF1345 domain-containing protein [Alphaproteobacteria bacterium]|nr:DUF1345 domain-containing protein [Alphaproteobacteria bacterium]MBV9899462.1 DUF1345 domain-containing protein [Alphaproteobacteria bacterium]